MSFISVLGESLVVYFRSFFLCFLLVAAFQWGLASSGFSRGTTPTCFVQHPYSVDPLGKIRWEKVSVGAPPFAGLCRVRCGRDFFVADQLFVEDADCRTRVDTRPSDGCKSVAGGVLYSSSLLVLSARCQAVLSARPQRWMGWCFRDGRVHFVRAVFSLLPARPFVRAWLGCWWWWCRFGRIVAQPGWMVVAFQCLGTQIMRKN